MLRGPSLAAAHAGRPATDGRDRLLPRLYRSIIRLTGRNLGVSAVIPDPSQKRVLVLQSRLVGSWAFPGGAVRRGESVYDAVARECREELGAEVDTALLTGVYYAVRLDSHTCVFRCVLRDAPIRLSLEHAGFHYAEIDALAPGERIRARDAMEYGGTVSFRTL
jgi:8-oxo-dGTP diphosphatase